MALDKLVDSTQLNTDLTSIANAIRTKGGTSAQLAFPQGFVSAIEAISGGGGVPGIADAEAGIITVETDIATPANTVRAYAGAPLRQHNVFGRPRNNFYVRRIRFQYYS